MKILVCGLPGSGKTWLSQRLIKHIKNCAWYNADFVRKFSKFRKIFTFLPMFSSNPPFQARSNDIQHAMGVNLVMLHPLL